MICQNNLCMLMRCPCLLWGSHKARNSNIQNIIYIYIWYSRMSDLLDIQAAPSSPETRSTTHQRGGMRGSFRSLSARFLPGSFPAASISGVAFLETSKALHASIRIGTQNAALLGYSRSTYSEPLSGSSRSRRIMLRKLLSSNCSRFCHWSGGDGTV